MKARKIAAMILILLCVSSREAHDEWLARRAVEEKSRAMFSGDAAAWQAKSVEASVLLSDRP